MPPRIHSEVRTRLAGRRPRLAAAAPGGASTLLGTNRPLFLSQCAALPLLLAALQVLDSPQNATNVNGQAGSLHNSMPRS